MTSPRRRLLPSVTIAAVVGIAGLGWFAGTRDRSSPPLSALQFASVAAKVVHFETFTASPAVVLTPVGEIPTPARLAPEEAVRFATLCELRLLAADTGLELTDGQWRDFAELVLELQAVRRTYEAGIAAVTEFAPGRHRLDIPAYPEAGDELRRRYEAGLRERLGPIASTAVREALGRQIEGRFAGFGVSRQVLDITHTPGRGRRDLEVWRTAQYWNSLDGEERVTTRRDVSFPASEDPAGESWDALLALTEKAG
jgi:hypothetical protein